MENKIDNPRDPFTIRDHLEQVEKYLNNELSKSVEQTKNQEPIEIAFAISLKSKTASRDWKKVQENLAKTLRSVLRNTDPHFRILIAGHKKPKIEELQHDRVIWIPVKFRPPVSSTGYRTDKMSKRKVIGAYLRKQGFSGYFMPLDADDWVHYRFVEFIRSRPITDAFILNSGLMSNLARREIWCRDHFYKGCGSSQLFYISNDEFPVSRKKSKGTSFDLVIGSHGKVIKKLKKHNKEFTMVDLPLVTWVLGHGDNLSTMVGKKDLGISAKDYKAKGQELENWFYDYFKIK